MAERDRLVVAWELRRDVHAWIAANPKAAMPAIKRAFGSLDAERVRGVVRKLCGAGLVCVDAGRYSVVREFDEPKSAARERLREIGLAAAPALVKANRSRPRAEDGTFVPGPVVLGARYTNRPGKKRPIQNQGGQGAGGLWRGGMASCLF